MWQIITTFILYFMIIFLIGYKASKKIHSVKDYMLAGRSLKGPVAALTVAAADMSSWLMMALPGLILVFGLSQSWIALGLFIGSFLNWQLVSQRLRIYTEIAHDSLTIPAYFNNRFNDTSGLLRLLTALIFLIFFTVYASSGLVAGARLLEYIFHISYHMGIAITLAIVVSYAVLGGFLALSWADFFQGSLMLFALLLVPLAGLKFIGSPSQLIAIVSNKGSHFTQIFHNVDKIQLISMLVWGLGYFGQPHILVKFMAAKHHSDLNLAKKICTVWMLLSFLGAIGTGFIGIAYLETELLHRENIFLVLAKELFNPWVTGILLAAVLSAIVSTIASLLIACSGVITTDIYYKFINHESAPSNLIRINRLSTLLVGCLSLLIAYDPNNTIAGLVKYAWSGLGASFGPIIILSLFWSKITLRGSFAGMAIGAITITVWPMLKDVHPCFTIYALLPGFILNFLTILIISKIDYKRIPEEAEDILKKVSLRLAQQH